jgi:DNA-binding XRE family transcriptional regulator
VAESVNTMKTKRKIIRFDDVLAESLRDPEFRRHFEAYDLPVRLAIEIASLRREKRITQAQLAAKMGVTQQFVARLENSEKTMPSLRTLTRLAEALGRRLHVSFL